MERERESERCVYTCVYIYIYIYTYTYMCWQAGAPAHFTVLCADIRSPTIARIITMGVSCRAIPQQHHINSCLCACYKIMSTIVLVELHQTMLISTLQFQVLIYVSSKLLKYRLSKWSLVHPMSSHCCWVCTRYLTTSQTVNITTRMFDGSQGMGGTRQTILHIHPMFTVSN